ncbi:2'-5' RNA ligase family protein [Haloarculaceae archaeon H-GB2-1]|nr:2'-5' RNA ligase family protein [Haloarculaceae archaeon H-GB1-1]MEA5388678.1 2'-5' RNA ligase family protein [Haloarculaceae archaeon H-GB11]MEA5406734.1 2'-5' RNA ligase family protein [Haloarculaceae archaeon H-GB2-1]
MYSLNVPIPSAVGALATSLGGDLGPARARTRGEHTLVVKRLVGDESAAVLEARAREALRGAPAFEARIAEVGVFENAASGPSPVVYLAVESPGLEAIHDDLCSVFDTVPDVEGDDYVPHVTIARGGTPELVERVRDAEFDPIEWTVSELVFWDAERGLQAGRLSLPN